ncbi:hypothetical protein MRB53_041693 [Persea americana]|nr:hypothetical protein MRB53_041693 [Persea americana]
MSKQSDRDVVTKPVILAIFDFVHTHLSTCQYLANTTTMNGEQQSTPLTVHSYARLSFDHLLENITFFGVDNGFDVTYNIISSSISISSHNSKQPGTACLCCRRRKLKCSREATGCSSCRKSRSTCIYPTVDTSVKKKRGPYKKKDRPARQAHLDHVVQYLSDPIAHAEAARDRERSDRPLQHQKHLD